jgi:hypothetical protein
VRIEHIAINVSDPEKISQWYCNPPEEVPDYPAMNPLTLHLAFYSGDLVKDYARLLNAGATSVGDPPTEEKPYGWCFMRDPWGLPIQLIRRDKPL